MRALLGVLAAYSVLLAMVVVTHASPDKLKHEKQHSAISAPEQRSSYEHERTSIATEPAAARTGAHSFEEVMRQLEELRGHVEHLTRSGHTHGSTSAHVHDQRRPAGHDAGPAPPQDASASQRQQEREELEAARGRARREELGRLRAAQEGHYIVGLKDGATEEHVEAVRGHARAAARRHHGAAHEEHVRFRHSFSRALRGFSARLSPAVKAELEAHERVKFVAPDGVVVPAQYAISPETPAPDFTSYVTPRDACWTQQYFIYSDTFRSPLACPVMPWALSIPSDPADMSSPNLAWHLDRLDQPTGGMTLDGRFDRGTAGGEGADVYVIDTGMRGDHPQLAGRVVPLFDVDANSGAGGASDCSENFHGTAVASVAAGWSVGAAPKASVFSVKVFERAPSSSSGACFAATTDSLVIAGIDAAIASMRERNATRAVLLVALSSAPASPGTPLKVNPAYTDAFARVRAAGALPVTAAGNQYGDACDAIPGNSPGAINVGASDQDDYRAGFSNWGSCVDLFAPGQNIRAAAMMPSTIPSTSVNRYDGEHYYWNTGSEYQTSSYSLAIVHGTSYAAALVAGAAALYRGANPSADAAAVEAAILGASLPALDPAGLKGAPNRLLNTRAFGLNTTAAAAGEEVAVGPAAYRAELFAGPTARCNSTTRSLAGLPRDLHRFRFFIDTSVSYMVTSCSGGWPACKNVDVKTVPRWGGGLSGVYLTRVRFEEHGRSHFPIFDVSGGQAMVYAGNPAMPSYQIAEKLASDAAGENLPFDPNDGNGAFWIRPGTYYVLIQAYGDATFRLNVHDHTCPTPNPHFEALALKSEGACRFAEFPLCGAATLVAAPENSVGLNQSDLFARAGLPSQAPGPSHTTRDLVIRASFPYGSGALSAGCGFSYAPSAVYIFVMDGCPSSPHSHVLASMACQSPVAVSSAKELLPGTYYFVYLFRASATDAVSSAAPYIGPPATLSFGTPQQRAAFCAYGTAPARPAVGTRVSVCGPGLDFVPTLYLFYGCPSDPAASRVYYGLRGLHPGALALNGGGPGGGAGVLTGDRSGNFTITVSDPECGGHFAGPGAGAQEPGPGGPGAQQCFPNAPPVDYYDIICPPPMTLSRLSPGLLFAEWGGNVSLWQSEAPGEGLLPAVTSYPSNAAWTAAGLPASHSGLDFNVTNGSGRGPRGACALELRVVDADGPFARARCPPREQELLARAGQCSVPAPDLVGDVGFDVSCVRPVDGAATAVQSVAPGTPLMVGESYEARIYSSAFPAGASCPLRFRVRRAATPRIAAGPASPGEIAGVVGGSPDPVPVDLSFALEDGCGDHARACRLVVRAAGTPPWAPAAPSPTPTAPRASSGTRPAARPGPARPPRLGAAADEGGQTCSGDLRRVLLSPYIRPDAAGAPGAVARTYQVALTCSYGAGAVASAAWSIPLRRPQP
eukprot:tig00001160_g7338.t1